MSKRAFILRTVIVILNTRHKRQLMFLVRMLRLLLVGVVCYKCLYSRFYGSSIRVHVVNVQMKDASESCSAVAVFCRSCTCANIQRRLRGRLHCALWPLCKNCNTQSPNLHICISICVYTSVYYI